MTAPIMTITVNTSPTWTGRIQWHGFFFFGGLITAEGCNKKSLQCLQVTIYLWYILSIAEVQTIEFPIRLLSSIPISCSQDQTSPAVSKLILWVYSFPLEFWTTGEKLSACATGTITHQAYWLQLELTSRPRLTKRLPNPLRPISLQFEQHNSYLYQHR